MRLLSIFPLWPEQASTFALEVDLFYIFLVVLTIFFSVAIPLVAIIFTVKYRRRHAGELPVQIEGGLMLELTWTIIPFIVMIFIFAWGAKLYYQMYTPPDDALEIFITGKQWMWRAQHPNGRREINELHIPTGRRVKLTMTSEDVLHAYFIPAFRTKTDVVPGRYTMSWFEATKPGSYHMFCAEYCGTQHSGMIGKVIAMDPSEYQTWLSGGVSAGSPAEAGQKLFASLQCNTCHLDDNRGRGPSHVGVYGKQVKLTDGTLATVDDAFIRESILTPGAKILAGYQNIMPTFQGQVSEEQIAALIAYLKSIGPKQDGATAPAARPAAAPAVKPAARPAVPRPAAPQSTQPQSN